MTIHNLGRNRPNNSTGSTATAVPDFDPADPPLALSHTEIMAAQRAGTAEPLSRLITDFVKYGDCWWILYNNGWLLVNNAGLVAALEQQSTAVHTTGTYLGGPCCASASVCLHAQSAQGGEVS